MTLDISYVRWQMDVRHAYGLITKYIEGGSQQIEQS